MSDRENDSRTDLLNALADEFTQRMRRDERPTIDEYAETHPKLAAEIRELFPALLLIEQFDPIKSTTYCGRHDRNARIEEPPHQLGEYRILSCIGRGGMGVVYEAVQEPLGRHVALKVLPISDAVDSRLLGRFKREAQAAARLHHTNIVPVFGVGEDCGVYYYVMQFIHGRPLDQVLSDMKRLRGLPDDSCWHLPSVSTRESTEIEADEIVLALLKLGDESGGYYRAVARLGTQIADALAYAHQYGVLHRDIKPANLLLDTQGTLWIADFGLAQIDGLAELTQPDDVIGTLRYMPPERFHGRTADSRGDIYSLGLTLYEMLTLRPAFSNGSRAELIHRILNSTPETPQIRDPRMPRDLVTIVLKAIEHEPERRYQNAEDLSEDLRRFLDDRPINARRQSARERLGRWCHRYKMLAALIATTVILLVALSVVTLVDSARLRDQLHEVQAAQREGHKQLFEATIAQANANGKSGDAGQRFQTLRILQRAKVIANELNLPEDALLPLRDEALAVLCRADAEPSRKVAAHPAGTASLDFDPSFERYARIGTAGDVTMHRVSDNAVLGRLPSPGIGFHAALQGAVEFSPEGAILQQLCVSPRGDLNLRLWDVRENSPRLLLEKRDNVVGPTAIQPNGSRIAVKMNSPLANDKEGASAIRVHVFDIATGSDCIEPLPADQLTQLAFHPTLPRLAVSDVSAVRIVELGQGAELQRWERAGTTCLGWSHDGRQLVAAIDEDTKVFRWDVRKQQELAPLIRHVDRPVESLAFDHAGNIIVTATRLDWRMWNARSGQLLWESTSPLPHLRFSADDKLLAGSYEADPEVGLFRVTSGEELERFALDAKWNAGSPRAVLHPDGRLLAATSRQGTVLWDVARQEEVGFLSGDRVPLTFESDGSLLTHADLPEGVVRWSLEVDAEEPSRFQFVSKEPLSSISRSGSRTAISGLETWSASADGRVIAMPGTARGATVFRANTDDGIRAKDYRPIELGPQYNVQWTSVSPHGEWVATGSNSWLASETDSVTVTVWESATGKRIKNLLVGQTGVPKFSPDGQWIAVLSGAYPGGVRLWRVGSWREGPIISSIPAPGGVTDVAFNPLHRLIATQGEFIRLLDTDTGRVLARLRVPERTSLAPQCFTPDGNYLLAFDLYGGRLYVWDLQAIRRQLAELQLDFRQ